MAIFRVHLIDGDKRMKTDLKAQNEESARSAAAEWFDCARWQVVDVRKMADWPAQVKSPNQIKKDFVMNAVSAGFKARLDYILDQICAEMGHGGGHGMRRFVAEHLTAAAQAGERSAERLSEVARNALATFLVETGSTTA
jgi:hypothetical protein